uniref:Uncharacterized protein n=1 Tax=Biomphalaria glabrata TaxID=6526 RepID=A0A2C9LID5_BIOGL
MEPQHKKEEKELGNLCVIQSTESLMCRQSQLKTGSIKCSCCSRKAEIKSQVNDQVVLASLSTDEKMRRRYSTPRSLKSSDFTSSSSHERTSPPRTKRHSVPAPAKRPLVQDDDTRMAHNNTRKASDDGCVWKLILPKDDSFRLNITCTKLDGSIEAKSTLHKSVETFMSQSFLANEAGSTQRSAHRFLANEAGSAQSQRNAHRFLANEAGSAQSQRSAHRYLANEAGSAQSQRSAHRYLANEAGSAQSQRSAHRFLANEAGSAQKSAHRFLRNKDKKESNIDKNLGNPKYKNVQRNSEEVMKPHRSPSELTDYKVNESWANLDVFSEPQKLTVPTETVFSGAAVLAGHSFVLRSYFRTHHNYSQMNECSHAQTASTSTDPLSQSMPRRSSRIDKKSSSSKCGAKLKIGLKTMNDIPVGVMSLSADSNDGAATSKSQESGCCLSEPTVHKSPGFYLIEESVDWSFPIQKILSDDNLVCFQGDQTPHFQTCLKHKAMDVTEDSSDLSTNYYKDNCKNKECSVEDSERNLDLPLNQAVELFSILKHKAKRLYATSSGELCPKHTRHKSRRNEFGPGGNDSTSNGSVTVCESRKQRHIALNLCARQPSENESHLSDCYNCSTKSVTSTTPSSSDSVTKLSDASWRSEYSIRSRSCSDTDFLKLVTLKEKSKLDKGDYADDKIGSKGNFVFSKQFKYSANCQPSLEKETLREVLNQEINCPTGSGLFNKHTVQKKMRVNVKAAKRSASLESSLDLYVVEKDLTRDVFIAKKEREPTKVISLEDDLAQGESTSSPKHKMSCSIQLVIVIEGPTNIV